jgi:hypothetical protein
MGRNEEFDVGHTNAREFWHISPGSNRESVEKHGLLPEKSETREWDDDEEGFAGLTIPAVFVATSSKAAAELGQRGYSGDVYRGTTRQPFEDDPNQGLKNKESQVLRSPVYPSEFSRVGHVADNGEVHWHREEDCHNGAQ